MALNNQKVLTIYKTNQQTFSYEFLIVNLTTIKEQKYYYFFLKSNTNLSMKMIKNVSVNKDFCIKQCFYHKKKIIL